MCYAVSLSFGAWQSSWRCSFSSTWPAATTPRNSVANNTVFRPSCHLSQVSSCSWCCETCSLFWSLPFWDHHDSYCLRRHTIANFISSSNIIALMHWNLIICVAVISVISVIAAVVRIIKVKLQTVIYLKVRVAINCMLQSLTSAKTRSNNPCRLKQICANSKLGSCWETWIKLP